MSDSIEIKVNSGTKVSLAQPEGNVVKYFIPAQSDTVIQVPIGNKLSIARPVDGKFIHEKINGSSISIATAVLQGADKTFTQAINVQSWTDIGDQFEFEITHGLAKNTSVSVVDSFGRLIGLDVEYVDKNTVKIITTAKFSGSVYFN